MKEAQSEIEEQQPGGAGSGRVDALPPPTLWIIKPLKCQNTCDGYEGTSQQGRDGSEDLPLVFKYKRIYEYSSKIKKHPTPQNTDQVPSLFLPAHHPRLIS